MQIIRKKIIAILACMIIVFASTSAIADSWQQSSGRWWYSRNNGSFACKEWLRDGNNWYYFDESGWMVTGWRHIGNWYYFNTSGAMVTGWQYIGGNWYFFNASGAMVTGWQYIEGKWYFFNNAGAMVKDWQQIDGSWYYFDNSGAMMTGWLMFHGKYYYCNESGAMVTGWLHLGSEWYYLNSSGVMVTGNNIRIDGKDYSFDSSGRWIDRDMGKDLTVESLRIKNTIIGPELYIRIKNNRDVVVDRVDFTVYCYDVYGDQVYGYDYYSYQDCNFNGTIQPGRLSPSNYYWDFYGYDGARAAEITIYKYHTATGETVEIPDNQQITFRFAW